MAASVRFTKAEREFIITQISVDLAHGPKEVKLQQSILDKLEKSELVKKKSAESTGIGWEAAAAAMREVLGASLALPPRPDWVWIGRMNKRISALGLTQSNCRSIAKVLQAKGWKVYSFEQSIWKADTLLAEAQLDIPQTRTPKERAPLSM